MTDHRSRREKLRRRVRTIPVLFAATIGLTLTAPLWLPVVVVADAIRLRLRFPLARLLAFGVCWCWIETAGVLGATGLWLVGRADDAAAHYRLQAWWAGALMRSLVATTGIDPVLGGADQVASGNALVLTRHASLADSLLSGWALCTEIGLRPRYVLKRELLFDPCLDIVGLRIPNHFLDRQAIDNADELAALRELAAGVGPGVVVVIFPEGTRANDHKRARALERIADRDPARAERLSALRRLLPPRPAGSIALLEGATDADVVLAWHTGFDGLDTFRGIIDGMARARPPVRFVMRRVPRDQVPEGDGFGPWLDDQWLLMDREADAALASSSTG